MKWRLTGTPNQQAIQSEALSRMRFPLERLKIDWMPEMGWRDLNGGFALKGIEPPKAAIDGVQPRGHEGKHSPRAEGNPEPLNGELEGRRFTMAVYYPGSARIFVDHRLEAYPALAMASVAAEVAHAVDENLPLNDGQRHQFIEMLGGLPSNMTWWEKRDYSTEYWMLAGEHFMPIYTEVYTDIPFGDVSSFQMANVLRNLDHKRVIEIMGIEPTARVPVTPPAPPPPPEPIIPPDAVIIPVPEFHRFGSSKIYHKLTHKLRGTPRVVTSTEGLRPCRSCKPSS